MCQQNAGIYKIGYISQMKPQKLSALLIAFEARKWSLNDFTAAIAIKASF